MTLLPLLPLHSETKHLLYALLGQFGRILDVVVMRREGLRGQAWIVFADIASATSALRAMQDFPFFERPMKIQYAFTKSDAAAKADGTWKKDLRTRKERLLEAVGPGKVGPQKTIESDEDVGQPNKTLFVENLPEATTDAMLAMLFQQFPGYEETRMVPGRPGIAFIDFSNDVQAGVALNGLQSFKITPSNAMRITYAKL